MKSTHPTANAAVLMPKEFDKELKGMPSWLFRSAQTTVPMSTLTKTKRVYRQTSEKLTAFHHFGQLRGSFGSEVGTGLRMISACLRSRTGWC
jgi:hypothetical protein